MEVSQNLLVAMMFVMVLSIGIGNILMGLSGVLDRNSGIRVDWIPLAWVFVLLLTSLELFWQTVEILSVEEWSFGEFLLVILGPVILLFATSLMLPEASRSSDGDYRAHYFRVSNRFFTLLALLMLWMVVLDLVFAGGMGPFSLLNLVEGAVFAALAVTKAERVHTILTPAALILLVVEAALRGSAGAG
jgi:hypothetical protein